MDMYKLKWTHLQSEIFRLLCVKAGQTLNLRSIARLLEVSPTAVSKSIKNLEKCGLVVIEKSETINQLSIKFNRDNPKAINLKRVENLKALYASGLVDNLSETLPGCTIILFGSYSFGEDVWINTEQGHKSDIDIAVIGTKDREIDLIKFEKLLERHIIINFYTSFKNIHENLRNNILSGILLNGRVEL
jgi:predicted nucleotidyltransferase/biotin operon repressor